MEPPTRSWACCLLDRTRRKTDIWMPLKVRNDPHMSFTRPVIGRLKPNMSRDQAGAAFETFITTSPDTDDRRDQVRSRRLAQECCRGRHDAPAADLHGRRGVRAAHRVRQRRQPAADPCSRAAAGNRDPACDRRQPWPRGSSVAHRKRPAVTRWRSGRYRCCWLRRHARASQLCPAGTLPRDAEIHIDLWVVAVTLTLALVAGVLLGIVPALHSIRGDVSNALREGAASSPRRSLRFRQGLIVAEMALALILLVGAGLLAEVS